MGKRPYIEDIIIKLKNDKFDEISNLEDDKVTAFVNDNKDFIIGISSQAENEWDSCSESIGYFIKALKTIETLKTNNITVHDKLYTCKNKDEVMKSLEPVEDLPFGNVHNVAKYIIKIIKMHNKTANPKKEQKNQDKSTNDKLKKTNEKTNPKKTLSLTELESLIKNTQNLFNQLLDFDERKINEILTEKFCDEYILCPELIDEFIKEVVRKHPESNPSSKKMIEKIALINKEHTDKINAIERELDDCKKKLFSLENDNKTLKTHLEDASAKLQKYDSESLKKAQDDLFSFNLNDLSCFINNSTTDIQVNIRKALMIKACEYVDALNLLKTKNILTTEQNLPSEIIQIILLELFHEKNLL